MTAPELMVELTNRGIRLTARGDRLAYDAPASVMTPDLAERVKRHKAELLAALVVGTVPVVERFDGGNVQVGNQPPVVGFGHGNEQPAFHRDGQGGVLNVVGIPAGDADAERLEGFAGQQLSDFGGVHTSSIPPPDGKSDPVAGERPEAHAGREVLRFMRVSVSCGDGRGWYDPAQARIAEALARADDSSQAPPTMTGPAPRLYPKPGGGFETFTQRTERYRSECGGLPPGARRPEHTSPITLRSDSGSG